MHCTWVVVLPSGFSADLALWLLKWPLTPAHEPLQPRFHCRCVIDTKPRTMDTEQLALLCNFAEMAVREMEKDKLCSLQRGDSLAEEMHADGLHRAVKALTEGVFVIDVMSPGWKILLMNEQAEEFAGAFPCLDHVVSSRLR